MSVLFGSVDFKSRAADVGLLVLRAVAGLSLAFGHGLGKMPPSARFIEGVERMGFPFPGFFAWSAASAEFFGGLFLAAGLLTRPSGFFIACTMIVAGFIRHAADPFRRKELAFIYLAIGIAFMLIGAGRYAVDAIIRKSERIARQ